MWNPTWWIYFKYTLSSKAAGKQQLVTANLIVLDHTLSHLQSHFQSSLAELLKATGSWQLLALVAGEAADRPSGLLVSCIPCPAKNGDHNKMRKQVWIFLQFILHSLGELEKYSLLRITLAHLFLQFYSPSNQVDLARRIQKSFRTLSCKNHQLNITCLWQTQQNSADGAPPGVCLLQHTYCWPPPHRWLMLTALQHALTNSHSLSLTHTADRMVTGCC